LFVSVAVMELVEVSKVPVAAFTAKAEFVVRLVKTDPAALAVKPGGEIISEAWINPLATAESGTQKEALNVEPEVLSQ
jgi:hypothetical protein